MASNFDFYTHITGLQPQAIPGPAEKTVGGEIGQALEHFGGQQVTRERQFLKEEGIRKASQSGEDAGSKLGFKPIQENNENDIAFNNSAMQTQKQVMQSDIRSSILRIKQNQLTNLNVNSIDNYDQQVALFTTKFLPNVNKSLQSNARNMLGYYSATHREGIVSQVDRLNRNIANSNLQVSVNNNQRDATNAAFGGDQSAAMALRANVNKSVQTALDSGNVSSTYAANTMKSLDDKIKFARYEGGFNAAIQSGKADKAISGFLSTNQKDLSPDEKQSLTFKFRQMLTNHKQLIFAQYGNIDQKVKDLAASVTLNGTNPATDGMITKMKSIVQEAYVGNPEKSKELTDELDFSKQRHNFNQSIKYLATDQIQSQLQKVEEKLRKDPNITVEKVRNLKLVEADTNRLIRDRRLHPYKYASEHAAVVQATQAEANANRGNVSIADGQRMGPAVNASIQDRDQSMIEIYKNIGTKRENMQLVSPKNLSDLSQIASENKPANTNQAIVTILKQHPNHMFMALHDIQKHVPLANMMLLQAELNPETSKHIPEMQAAAVQSVKDLEDGVAKSERIKKDDVRIAIAHSDYGAAIHNMDGDPTEFLNDQIDFAYKVALAYQKGGAISKTVKQAVNDTVTAHVQIDSYNGSNFVIPLNKNYNTEEIKDATRALLTGIDPKSLIVPSHVHRGLPDAKKQKLYRDELQSDAYPVLNADNSGMHLVDSQKRPLKTIRGNQIGFKFQGLINGISDLQKVKETEFKKGVEKGSTLRDARGDIILPDPLEGMFR